MPLGLFVSVDVDSLGLYTGLYGRGEVREEEGGGSLLERTWTGGVRRFLDLFGELGVRATFFVVGRDLDEPAVAAVAREAVECGHALGNHTWSHPYGLTRLGEEDARREIGLGHEACRRLSGRAAAVFRAPGYNMTSREYGMLAEVGCRYDSSPLPSYPYLLVKWGVLASLAVCGKESQSIWGDPRGFLGPRRPYERAGVTVLPCATTPVLRLPVIGTALAVAPEALFGHMLRCMMREPFVALEFHAADLMEMGADGLPAALEAQRDLRVPLAFKLGRFRRFVGELSARLEPFVPG